MKQKLSNPYRQIVIATRQARVPCLAFAFCLRSIERRYEMNIVAFGGGTNSTAMLIGMYEKKIPVDLILFADPGSDMPNTYFYIGIMNKWLIDHGMPEIKIVRYVDKYGNNLTLEDDCLRSGTLPSIAFGFKTCSMKFKLGPQDKYCNNYQPCIDAWAKGEKVSKYIGYDAGEERRKSNADVFDLQDKKYSRVYSLIEWGWYREDCENKIKEYGLPLPGKSSCFFCPSMKKKEIQALKKNHPTLFDRAICLEESAKENLCSIKGLGRSYSWKQYIFDVENQISLCSYFDDVDAPCDCYDGYAD
jgi:hypothetical protein